MMFSMEDASNTLSTASRPVLDGQRVRRPARMASVVVEEIAHRILGGELHAGLALVGHLPPRTRLHALAEADLATGGPKELRAGLRLALSPFTVDAGAGLGLGHVPATPAWRVFAVVRFAR